MGLDIDNGFHSTCLLLIWGYMLNITSWFRSYAELSELERVWEGGWVQGVTRAWGFTGPMGVTGVGEGGVMEACEYRSRWRYRSCRGIGAAGGMGAVGSQGYWRRWRDWSCARYGSCRRHIAMQLTRATPVVCDRRYCLEYGLWWRL